MDTVSGSGGTLQVTLWEMFALIETHSEAEMFNSSLHVSVHNAALSAELGISHPDNKPTFASVVTCVLISLCWV